MANRKDIAGRKFGKLTAIQVDHTEGSQTYWRCACDCGKETVARIGQLSSGSVRSCGCLRSDSGKVRKGTMFLTYQGETRSFAEWARRLGVGLSVLRYRHMRDFPIERIMKPGRRAR